MALNRNYDDAGFAPHAPPRWRVNRGRVYHAGDRPGVGLYREVERGIVVRLVDETPLPDLNSYQPSRFLSRNPLRDLLPWLGFRGRSGGSSVLYEAGQRVPAGVYQEVERRLSVCLVSDGPLPDLQTPVPSRYYGLEPRKLRVRRRLGKR